MSMWDTLYKVADNNERCVVLEQRDTAKHSFLATGLLNGDEKFFRIEKGSKLMANNNEPGETEYQFNIEVFVPNGEKMNVTDQKFLFSDKKGFDASYGTKISKELAAELLHFVEIDNNIDCNTGYTKYIGYDKMQKQDIELSDSEKLKSAMIDFGEFCDRGVDKYGSKVMDGLASCITGVACVQMGLDPATSAGFMGSVYGLHFLSNFMDKIKQMLHRHNDNAISKVLTQDFGQFLEGLRGNKDQAQHAKNGQKPLKSDPVYRNGWASFDVNDGFGHPKKIM